MKTDTEILNYILSRATCDGYGGWHLPWLGGWSHKPSIEEAKEYITHRMNTTFKISTI